MEDLNIITTEQLESQLRDNKAGTCLIPVHAENFPEAGEWIDDYFVLAVYPENDNYSWCIVIKSSLRGLNLIYIRVPPQLMGKVIGRGGCTMREAVDLLNANGFAAQKISFRNGSEDRS